MTRKYLFVTILSIVLFMSLLQGCSSTDSELTRIPADMSDAAQGIPIPFHLSTPPTEVIPTPTEVPPSPDPELSIVWSDDFEDGDFADWEEVGSTGFYYVNEGALTVGPDSAGDIVHRSDVAHGTWSFDVFISDQMMSQNEIGVTCDEDYIYCWSMVIRAKQNTVIDVTRVENGVESKVAEFQSEGHNRGAQRG